MSNDEGTFGKRVKAARERAGLTRPVVGQLLGKSAEWVKAVENGRLQIPRIHVLMRLGEIIGVSDISELVGDAGMSAVTYNKSSHHALADVRRALTAYHFGEISDEPETVDSLEHRVSRAWKVWHGTPYHRTGVSELIPDLISDLRQAERAYEGNERRKVRKLLAQAYHISQLFLSFQPAAEFVTLTGDRAMTAAQDADSPRSIAAAAWYMSHVFRDAGEAHESRVDLAVRAASTLDPDASREDLAEFGLLQLACALSFAKIGRSGDAHHYWDKADRIARKLGDGYSHPWLLFGRGMVDAYAITINLDSVSSGSAVEAAGKVDFNSIPSLTRQSFHMIESARAYRLQKEDVAVMHLLSKAYAKSPETVKFNLFTRSAVNDLATRGNALVRADAEHLAREIGVTPHS
ncbi:helix-turn-helix domain-containing protein [Nocardiopsis sediminis]|uniref:Helix-turn-helix domain-containing protein n=1 Tax=Nocardiopsis sediminis TaxID=1778267 RepID=A0ABV8FS10_9ACTN